MFDFRRTLILTSASMRTRYRNSMLGFAWVILNPLILMAAQAYVFVGVLKIEMENYALYLMSGLLPWIFFSQTLDMTATLYVFQGPLLKSLNLQPMTLTLAQVIDNAINTILAIIMIFLIYFVFISDHGFSARYPLQIFLGFIPWAVSVSLISFIVGVLHVSYRDTKFVMSFFLQLGFYLTPILYPSEFVPKGFSWVINFNPIFVLVKPMQIKTEDFAWPMWVYQYGMSWMLTGLIFIIVTLVWKSERNRFYAKI